MPRGAGRRRRDLAGQPVRELTGAVGGAVVDHEHAPVGREHLSERMQHALEVLALVVRGEADRHSLLSRLGHGTYHRPHGGGPPRNADVAVLAPPAASPC